MVNTVISINLYFTDTYITLRFFAVSLFLFTFIGVNQTANAKERMFAHMDVQEFCSEIKGRYPDNLAMHMDGLIKKAGITKEQWNKKYAFKVYCLGATPLSYSLTKDVEDFRELADYGVDLNHPFVDEDGNISTVKDYALHKRKTTKSSIRAKWMRILKIIKKKKAKSCNEQPDLHCTATYPLYKPKRK